MDADYADDITHLVNTPAQAKYLLNSLEQVAGDIDLNMKANKMEYLCFNWEWAISPLNGGLLKLADNFCTLAAVSHQLKVMSLFT